MDGSSFDIVSTYRTDMFYYVSSKKNNQWIFAFFLANDERIVEDEE
jgi:outer membrane protein assembly factor BamE (lipoprotein component of BamABCDE complex)